MAEATLILPDGAERRLDEQVSIGRDELSDVRLESATVSRSHALVTFRNRRWWITDTGSVNGTQVNGDRISPGLSVQLRHGDRITLGTETMVFAAPDELRDPDRTDAYEDLPTATARPLSPLQLQIVQSLCAPWLAGGTLDELPSNEEIAARLGTPEAAQTIKAALRRVYAKAGLTEGTPHAKRRALCRIARQRGWI